MKNTQLLMGMPITVSIVDSHSTQDDIAAVFDYFKYVDETFSTYKATSEVSRINNGQLTAEQFSNDMIEIFQLADQTKQQTNGYFDIQKDGKVDPSGIVKGWAIQKASELLLRRGLKNFFIDAGGDIQASGNNEKGAPWRVGIRNPFNRQENVKVLQIVDKGIATSGTAIRGQHIWNPHKKGTKGSDDPKGKEVVSLTVVGPNVYEADRFATAAFAMGEKGIEFVETLPGFEGYMIDTDGMATMTSGFEGYVVTP